MSSLDRLRRLGLFDARAPRYTSYPPANHFGESVGPGTVMQWQRDLAPGSRVSLYLHIPYCRRLCWFCACRTQGTTTDRPLIPYLDQLRAEMALVSANLPRDVVLSQIHLGGGTPTLLPPDMIRSLGEDIAGFRPWADDVQFSVEIDPTEVDQSRISALQDIGMTRASIGVQDFDPVVQECIGRIQSFDQTREVVDMLRDANLRSLNMDILYGLPHQDRARMADSVQRVLSLSPDRVALYGYAHVPWMAKRQVMIPTDALPDAEERLTLFDTARRLFLWDGYREIGIDHFAREGDSLADADRMNTMRRNFQGYTDDSSDVLIGLGASAISRYPQGFAQNHSTSSRYAKAISESQLSTVRGHAMTSEDLLRADMIERIMCRFELDLDDLSACHAIPVTELRKRVGQIPQKYPDHVEMTGNMLRLTENARLIARIIAADLDEYAMPEGRHSRAL